MNDEASTIDRADRSVDFFLKKNAGHVHMVGICGIGMAGLAVLLRARGFKVTGCDVSSGRMADWLAARGIPASSSHEPEHMDAGVEWVVRSAAVSPESVEIAYASSCGKPVFRRGEVLPRLISGRESVAVGGTHGKTTTAAFVAQLLHGSGHDPSWCIGGETDALGGVAAVGRGDVIVVEADESDGTIALYRPAVAVVTNVEFDHMEHFESCDVFEGCFRVFAQNVSRKVFYCGDDPRAAALCGEFEKAAPFGFTDGAFVRGRDLVLNASSLSFLLEYDGRELGRVDVPVPGGHNALNALAASAVALELGLSFAEIRRGLARVALPRRRFERVVEKEGITVISDYAHHPSEIAALVRTASRLKHDRLLGVFQPHRYTRTLALARDFPRAFQGLNKLVLVPVYAASEGPLPGGTIWDLYSHFRRETMGGGSSGSAYREAGAVSTAVMTASSLEQTWEYFRQELREGDILLVIGAGDVEQIADWARAAFGGDNMTTEGCCRETDVSGLSDCRVNKSSISFDRPLARRTTLKVGGKADAWVEVRCVEDLRALLKWTGSRGVPFNLLGAGSNVLISDLGLRGVTAHLSGAEFQGIREDAGEVVAGAAVPLMKLLDWLQENGWKGMEFTEGIPGTVGGALHMNAGAHGRELGDCISWVRCLNKDGSECMFKKSELGCSYRSCVSLENRVAIEAGFALSRSRSSDIRRRRAENSRQRKWLHGLRSAGSVFRNPEGGSAGRLVEKAELKGLTVGGARVSREHANIIVTGENACASDVIALIRKMCNEVKSRFGVELETEIVLL